MIPENTKTYDVQSNFVGEKAPLTIAHHAMPHIMDILTNMYSDPTLAAIRETAVNALDSHIAAGNDAPIKVYTPTKMAPTFVVQDFGTGMSIDELTTNFANYGDSTKQTTNEQAGMYGIGSKSPLAIVPQFIIESIKDGVKAVATISRTPEGTAEWQIIDTSATDDPNGVKITIPIQPDFYFNEKVDELFRWWTPGTVLVNDEQPAYALEEYTYHGVDVWAKEKSGWGTDDNKLVMGGIPYCLDIDHEMANLLSIFKQQIVVMAPIGSVSITPAREALNYEKDNTQAYLKTVFTDYADRAIANLQKEFDACATHYDAWKKHFEWTRLKHTFTYRGQDIPKELDQEYIRVVDVKRAHEENNYKLNDKLAHSPSCLITGVETITPYVTGRINSYRRAEGYEMSKYAIVLIGKVSGWLNGAEILDYSVIKKHVAQGAGQTRTVTYECSPSSSTGYRRWLELPEIKKYPTVIYQDKRNRITLSNADLDHDNEVVVYLAARQINKLTKTIPHAISAKQYLENERLRLDALITDEERNMIYSLFLSVPPKGIDPNRFDDPIIKEWITSHQIILSDDANKFRSVVSRLGIEKTNTVSNPLDRYPLAYRSQIDDDHTIWYMNTYYREVLAGLDAADNT